MGKQLAAFLILGFLSSICFPGMAIANSKACSKAYQPDQGIEISLPHVSRNSDILDPVMIVKKENRTDEDLNHLLVQTTLHFSGGKLLKTVKTSIYIQDPQTGNYQDEAWPFKSETTSVVRNELIDILKSQPNQKILLREENIYARSSNHLFVKTSLVLKGSNIFLVSDSWAYGKSLPGLSQQKTNPPTHTDATEI